MLGGGAHLRCFCETGAEQTGGAEWSKHSLGRAHPTRAGVAEAAALPSEGALQVGWVKRTLQALRFLYQRHERARHLLQAGSSGGHVCWLRRPEDASEVPEMQVDSQWWR